MGNINITDSALQQEIVQQILAKGASEQVAPAKDPKVSAQMLIALMMAEHYKEMMSSMPSVSQAMAAQVERGICNALQGTSYESQVSFWKDQEGSGLLGSFATSQVNLLTKDPTLVQDLKNVTIDTGMAQFWENQYNKANGVCHNAWAWVIPGVGIDAELAKVAFAAKYGSAVEQLANDQGAVSQRESWLTARADNSTGLLSQQEGQAITSQQVELTNNESTLNQFTALAKAIQIAETAA